MWRRRRQRGFASVLNINWIRSVLEEGGGRQTGFASIFDKNWIRNLCWKLRVASKRAHISIGYKLHKACVLKAVVEDSMNEFANSDLKLESEEHHSPLHSNPVPTHPSSCWIFWCCPQVLPPAANIHKFSGSLFKFGLRRPAKTLFFKKNAFQRQKLKNSKSRLNVDVATDYN